MNIPGLNAFHGDASAALLVDGRESSMIERHDRTVRMAVVDSLRGIASLGVAWFHITNGGHLLNAGWLKSSGAFGWLGVEMFFVISGFIIPYAMFCGDYRLKRNFGTFVLKRVIRLDPPYLVAILISVGLWYMSARTPGFRGSAHQFTSAQ